LDKAKFGCFQIDPSLSEPSACLAKHGQAQLKQPAAPAVPPPSASCPLPSRKRSSSVCCPSLFSGANRSGRRLAVLKRLEGENVLRKSERLQRWEEGAERGGEAARGDADTGDDGGGQVRRITFSALIFIERQANYQRLGAKNLHFGKYFF